MTRPVRNRRLLWCCTAALAAVYYVGPLLPVESADYLIVLLLTIQPLVCVLLGMALGAARGFVWQYPLLAGLLFLPAAWIFYNDSAAIYALIYAAVAAAGCLLGMAAGRFVRWLN